jgi:signal transduction histidine kinase
VVACGLLAARAGVRKPAGQCIEYTDAGGELAVSMHTRDTEVVVRIRDSGIGIAPGALPRIFALFRQTDEADERSRSGLGIGLAGPGTG